MHCNHVAKWIISAMVDGVERRGDSNGHSQYYVTFCDATIGIVASQKLAALKLAELADKGE